MEIEEEGENASSTMLSGFLFGNIDKKGHLENDILDEESKRHLDGLSTLAIGHMVREMTEDADEQDSDAGSCDYDDDGTQQKSAAAIDYSDISEVAAEDEQDEPIKTEATDVSVVGQVGPPAATTTSSQGGSDTNLMPPPSWIPGAQGDGGGRGEGGGTPGGTQPSAVVDPGVTDPGVTPPSDTTRAPLADMLPPELAGHDVREWFPEFQPGKVLRFSSLFRPVHTPHIWKRKKKREDEATVVKSETGDGTTVKREEDGGATVKEEEREDPFKLKMGRAPRPDEMMIDDAVRILQPENGAGGESGDEGGDVGTAPPVAAWRYGPAQLWYDMLGVSDTGENLDYGFTLKSDKENARPPGSDVKTGGPDDGEGGTGAFPAEAYYMVSQLQWEDDIIWNSEDARQSVMASLSERGASAGWLPSNNSRTAEQYLTQQSNGRLGSVGFGGNKPVGSKMLTPLSLQRPILSHDSEGEAETWYSMFPIENEALIHGCWEDDIIWDAEAMQKIPKPPILTLDPNDENIILDIPEDCNPKTTEQEPATKKEKDVKKSKILLGKAGILKEEEEDVEEEPNTIQSRNPFNLSNDEYYNPKLTTDNALRTNLGVSLIQHSTPAVELWPPFFQTHMGPTRLRNFHRPPLKKYSHGVLSTRGAHPVFPLQKTIKRKAKLREQERMASGGGDMFFMRTPEDLTGKDGDIVLAEYSEEFPSLVMQVGMATKIKNYYKRKPGKDNNPPQYAYGELAYAHTSPFLSPLAPGQCVPAFENNMFRSTIYQHVMPETDFIIIRTRQHYYIREVEHIFTVGQQCPLAEVPGPNSKRSNNFIRDFLQVFIYRLFWKSKDTPRRIKMEDTKKAFPSHSESSIRKRLKLCADFKRTGMDSNWWVVKSDFRLPTEEEMRAMVSPEQCCTYYSMLAAEQRLKDAGYGEKSLFAADEDNEEDAQVKMDDEVKAAPWNTTRAYISAMKGRCLLSLSGLADPTGCGEGFSYVKVPNKPQPSRDEATNQTPVKRTVTGTDADLRKLSLKNAEQLLRKFGVPEAEIKKLSRWEVIDVVRTMSTEQAKSGQEGMTKFARGNRFSVAEHQEKYKEECQRIFELQNRVLSSKEVLSTDEESRSADESDIEEMGKNLESMLANKKTSSQISLEREEAERRELQKMLAGEDCMKKGDKKKKDDDDDGMVRKLKITRTFRNEEGKEYTRTEIVRRSAVIDTYMRIRQTKDNHFIRSFATLDDTQKEEMKKERRRIQEKLRRIKRNQEKDRLAGLHPPPMKKMKKKKKELPNLKLKCGACGQIGHMRTNKECPLYQRLLAAGGIPGQFSVAMSEEQEEAMEKSDLVDEDLINVEGTKVTISKQLVQHADQVRRKSLVLKFPKLVAENKKRRRAGTIIHCDYLKKPHKASNRRRTDPVVTMSTIFESILNELRDMPHAQPFLMPVNPKLVPDYYKIVKKAIDLQTMRESIRNRKYQSREAFLVDINQIMTNCELYNGPKSVLTQTSQNMLDLCLQRLAEKEDKLMRLEKAINPLLDDNDLVAFSYILATVIEDRLKTLENSYPFHQPVNKKFVKDYYEVIKKPMDLATLLKNVNAHMYRNREQFIDDLSLIHKNSIVYNGRESSITQTAARLIEICHDAFSEQEESVVQLEESIRATEEAALEAADTDSVITGTSFTGGGHDGGDLESVDSSGLVHGHTTIAEDASNDSTHHEMMEDYEDASSAFRNISRDEEFVDVEGDDEEVDYYSRSTDFYPQEGSGVDDSLAQDLHMTPENSDDEMAAAPEYYGKLSGSGSDSEHSEGEGAGEDGGGGAPQGYRFDDNNTQDYLAALDAPDPAPDDAAAADAAAADAAAADAAAAAAAAAEQTVETSQYDYNEEDSFDPNEFFRSFAKSRAENVAPSTLAEEEGGREAEGGVEAGGEGEGEEDESAQYFNMDEFLQH